MLRVALLAVLMVSGTVFFIHRFPGTPNPNEYSRLYQIRAVVENGHLHIDSMIDRWGHLMDKAQYRGHYYSDKSFGLSALAIPVYALYTVLRGPCTDNEWMKYLLSLICVALPHLIALAMIYRYYIYGQGHRSARLLTLTGFAFGTIAFSYATLFYSHVTGAAFCAIAFILIDRFAGQYRLYHAAIIGALLGMAVILEYPLVIITGWLWLLYLIYIWKFRSGRSVYHLIIALIVFAIPLIAQGYVHAVSFGHPLATGYGYKSSAVHRMYHAVGLFGVYLPSWQSIRGVLVSPSRGMFYYSPFLVCALYSVATMIRQKETRLAGVIIAGIVASYSLFAVSVVDWQAGWTIGPRYYLAVIPFLIIPLIRTATPYSRSNPVLRFFSRIVYPALIFWSMVHCMVITSVFHLIPENFHVPLWEFSIPLLKRGYQSFNLAELLGISGMRSLIIVYGTGILIFGAAYTVWLRVRRPVYSLLAMALSILIGLTAVGATYYIAEPDTTDKHFEFSKIFLYWNKPVDRLRELYIIHTRDPVRVDYQYLLAQQLKDMGFYATALGHINRVIAKAPTHQAALKDKVTLTTMLDQTAPNYKKLLHTPPVELLSDKTTLFAAVRLLNRYGNYKLSDDLLRAALEAHPHMQSLKQMRTCISYINSYEPATDSR